MELENIVLSEITQTEQNSTSLLFMNTGSAPQKQYITQSNHRNKESNTALWD